MPEKKTVETSEREKNRLNRCARCFFPFYAVFHSHSFGVFAAVVIALVCGFIFSSKAKSYVNPSAIVDVSVVFAIRSF